MPALRGMGRTLRSAVVPIAAALALSGCPDRETTARYREFRIHFNDVRESMLEPEVVRLTGEPQSRTRVTPGGQCRGASGATEALVYEFRRPGWWNPRAYTVDAMFVVCINSEHRVVDKTFIQY
jgi:hypothetical protein